MMLRKNISKPQEVVLLPVDVVVLVSNQTQGSGFSYDCHSAAPIWNMPLDGALILYFNPRCLRRSKSEATCLALMP